MISSRAMKPPNTNNHYTGQKIMKEYVNNIPEAHLIDAKNPLVNEWHP